MEVKEFSTKFGKIKHIRLTNKAGASVTFSNIGAGIVSIVVPDKNGLLSDVVLGYNDPQSWMNDGPCAGKIAGRYANRIARGKFSIGEEIFQLAINNGPNHLHGGPTGFQNRIWDIIEVDDNHIVMKYVSADGEENYPGTLNVRIEYKWTDDNTLVICIEARTDKPTVLNLTNHSYFNLSGHDSGCVLSHLLTINAKKFLETDETLIPLEGDPRDVKNTPMDFTSAKVLGEDINTDFPALKYGKGYDNCWVIDDYNASLRTAVILFDPRSGRQLEILTNQPGVQVYTGNWLNGSPKGKDGYEYSDYDGVAIECQNFPDAPNRPDFPSALLIPGEKYFHHTEFRFSAK